MRSTVYVTVSIIVHVVCVVALAMSPTGQISGDADQGVIEVGLDAGATESQPQAELPKAEEPKAVPEAVKQPEAPKPAKTIVAKKPAVPTKLPEKEVLPERLDPVIADEDMVETASAQPEVATEVAPEVTPAALSELEAEESELEEATATEAASEDLQNTEDPSPEITSVGAATSAAVATATQAGSSQGSARSYLDLKQAQGNPAPKYPMQARLQKRQGQVELLYLVTPQGKVRELKILKSSGFRDLDQAAVDAVSKYKFVAGQEGWARHPIVFNLKGPSETLPSRLRSVGAQTE